jgi:acyl carrier protein
MMEVDAKCDEKITATIAEGVSGRFRKTRITSETQLQKELGLDSIGILALVFRFEELFGIDIAQMGINIDVAKLKTVGDVIAAGRAIMRDAVATKRV